MTVRYQWRGAFADEALAGLHGEAFGHPSAQVAWNAQLHRHSLGWVCATDEHELIGFVNVAWDGMHHAFLLDAIVSPARWGHGVGTELVRVATSEARAAGCQWLHVDFEDHLRPFYFEVCGFTPTTAGVITL